MAFHDVELLHFYAGCSLLCGVQGVHSLAVLIVCSHYEAVLQLYYHHNQFCASNKLDVDMSVPTEKEKWIK